MDFHVHFPTKNTAYSTTFDIYRSWVTGWDSRKNNQTKVPCDAINLNERLTD